MYCDLHRKVSSVKALSGVNKGRLIDKPRAIVLEDVRLRVSHRQSAKSAKQECARFMHTHAAVAPSIVHRASEIGQTRSEFATTDDASGDALTQLALLAIEGKTAWGVR